MRSVKYLVLVAAVVLGGWTTGLSQQTDEARKRPLAGKNQYVLQDETTATKYQSVVVFFQCVDFRVKLLRRQGWMRPITAFMKNFGVEPGTPAWELVISTSDEVAGLQTLTNPLTQEDLERGVWWEKQFKFHESLVLSLRGIYRRFLSKLEELGGDPGLLEQFIENKVKKQVLLVSTAPREHPNNQRLLQIESMFEREP